MPCRTPAPTGPPLGGVLSAPFGTGSGRIVTSEPARPPGRADQRSAPPCGADIARHARGKTPWNTGTSYQLWNEVGCGRWRPKDEATLADEVAVHLREDLRGSPPVLPAHAAPPGHVSIRITGDDLLHSENRVVLDPKYVDEFGFPVARVVRSKRDYEKAVEKAAMDQLKLMFNRSPVARPSTPHRWSTAGTTVNCKLAVTAADSSGFSQIASFSEVVSAPPPCIGLTLLHAGSGSDPTPSPAGSPGCPQQQFIAGTVVALTAAPATGWTVGSWMGTDDNTSQASSVRLSW